MKKTDHRIALTLGLNEAAGILGVSPDTIQRWVALGRLRRVSGLRAFRVLVPGVARELGLSIPDFLQAIGREQSNLQSPFGAPQAELTPASAASQIYIKT